MDFLAGLGGFLAGIAAFFAGMWVGKQRRPSREGQPVTERDGMTLSRQVAREFYNFLHFDGDRMPSAEEERV